MNHDDQVEQHSSSASGTSIKRMLAALAFMFGGFAAELAKPVNCNLIHRPAARQPQRRPQESA